MGNELMTDGLKPKSFWEKPEGTTGMVFAIGAVGLGGYWLFRLLPSIIALLQNAIYASILGLGLCAFLYVVFDKRFQALAWFGYQSVMRFITSWFVTVDSLGIVQNYIKSLKQNLDKMQNQIGNLKGQMTNLTRTISTNKVQADNALRLAAQAKKVDPPNNNAIQLNLRSAARLQDSNEKLQALYTKLEILYRALVKMSDNAETIIQDTQDEVDTRKREFEATSAGMGAMRSAMSIIKGDTDKKAIFDMSMDHLADSISSQVGEMDNFMRMSEKITGNIDLQNGVFEEEGMKMLEDWTNKSSSALMTPAEKKKLVSQAQDPDDVVDLSSGNGKGSKSKYAAILKK